MKLSEYLKTTNLTQEKFAHLVGVTRPFITNILNGKKSPSVQLAGRIEKVTKGKVTLRDLLNPNAPSRLKKKKFEKTKT